ncbi:MAG: TetR/AcrR family transcriptional regulator [Afipia sp.]|jgi:AcrR family transcriptional regulator|nr:TetR/AcrR family transcriptional regulator [Afipia sp.]
MSLAPRLSSDLRRELILEAARGCFARYGYSGTTTKSVAQAAHISEGLLFKHFPTKAALYADILAEACEADPEFLRLLGLEPSTGTLVVLIREMVAHLLEGTESPDQEEAQRLRLLASSQLNDGEFARLLFAKIGDLIAPVFNASLEKAIAAGDCAPVEGNPINLFWFSHQVVHMIALMRLPPTPPLPLPALPELSRQVCLFILRGIGLTADAISSHINSAVLSPLPVTARIAEST